LLFNNFLIKSFLTNAKACDIVNIDALNLILLNSRRTRVPNITLKTCAPGLFSKQIFY